MMAREIPIHGGLVALVDDADYDRLAMSKWYLRKRGLTGYAFTVRDRKRTSVSWISMHHEILPAPPGTITDHINGNTLDNRRENLRLCTPLQNRYNSRKRGGPTSSSRYKGVFWNSQFGKWAASIGVDKKKRFLGYHRSEVSAAIAYNQAALQFHGEYAKLNPVPFQVAA